MGMLNAQHTPSETPPILMTLKGAMTGLSGARLPEEALLSSLAPFLISFHPSQ